MIRKKVYIYVALSCLVWTGCSRTIEPEEHDEAVPVQFSAALLSPHARAAIDGESFANGTTVTIYGVSHGTADYAESQWTDTPFMNAKTATVGATGELTYSPVQFFNTDEKYSFFSLFKGKSGESGVSVTAAEAAKAPVLTITLQTSPLSQADVMLASVKNATKVTARNGMDFTFEHLLTQIRFNMAKSSTYTKESKLTKVMANSFSEATVSVGNTDLVVNTVGSKVDIEVVDCTASPLTLTQNQQAVVQTGSTNLAYAMLFPGEANTMTFTFTIEGKQYPLVLEGTWKKGVIYTYDVTFDKALKLIVTGWSSETWGVEIGGSSVLDASDWTSGATLDKEVL